MKIGIMLGDDSIKRGGNSNLQTFFTHDKLAIDIVNAFTHINGIEATIIRRDVLNNLPNKVNGENFNFVISLSCLDRIELDFGVQVKYFDGSREGKAIANIFQRNLEKATGIRGLGTKAISSYDREGYVLKR